MISISAHKIYGPKGIGTFRQQRIKYRFAANDSRGGHEFGMRSGTLATHQIVGIGEAAELMCLEEERL